MPDGVLVADGESCSTFRSRLSLRSALASTTRPQRCASISMHLNSISVSDHSGRSARSVSHTREMRALRLPDQPSALIRAAARTSRAKPAGSGRAGARALIAGVCGSDARGTSACGRVSATVKTGLAEVWTFFAWLTQPAFAHRSPLRNAGELPDAAAQDPSAAHLRLQRRARQPVWRRYRSPWALRRAVQPAGVLIWRKAQASRRGHA